MRAPALSQRASPSGAATEVGPVYDGWKTLAELTTRGKASRVAAAAEHGGSVTEVSAETEEGRTVLMCGLERYMAYEYRIRSSNQMGSTLSDSSGPILTDVVTTNLLRPPRVTSSGSASFIVEWIGQTSHCRPQVHRELSQQSVESPHSRA